MKVKNSRPIFIPGFKLLTFIVTSFITCPCFAQSGHGYVQSVYFKRNSATIESKYHIALNELAKGCLSDSFVGIKIFAFTDTTGSEIYNDLLSNKRAMAIYNYIDARCNLDSTKTYVTWLGESDDIYDLHFSEAHAQQKCVDIWISFYKKEEQSNQ